MASSRSSEPSATTTRERPILFSGDMVRAIMVGTKTQTRRVIKHRQVYDTTFEKMTREQIAAHLNGGTHVAPDDEDSFRKGAPSLCPYGKPGERLWVRETWGWVGEHHHEDHRSIAWKADRDDWLSTQRWRPSIHMPRWASRILLEITDVRVQRVQEISSGDSEAEGVSPNLIAGVHIDIDGGLWPEGEAKLVGAFRELWDSLNAKRGFGWDANPWVWCLTFRRLDSA